MLLPENPMEFISETGVLPVKLHDVRIDLVFAQLPFEEQAIRRSQVKQFFPIPMKVCSVEDLILQKSVSSRQKDWDDIATVTGLQKENIDWQYLLLHHTHENSKHAMKNQTNDTHELRNKMNRFNAWEQSYIKQLSEEERFKQFVELFELSMSSDTTKAEKAHREHLEQLARIARTIREKKRRTV